jgi:murein DD-endopeptidase MepM/ murein hydrolase activator NlpD
LAGQAESLKSGMMRTPATKAAAARKPTALAAKQETAQAKMSSETKASTHEPATATEAKKTAVVSETANPEFRWPARGRIIQGFKPGGNDGINIAVPEGTSVKAAESGVVAYAGNELKGYGNLILIRHPNGFVSAYANNGDLEVKRGETVKRGQTIAKSGQSGNVASPQLHFELRKGTKPVDPTQYLAGV